ncbi:zonular occludens toxin domain-containing protein [Pseudomonas asiatica]|uniref:zonular occludens toxin domain-containing protein n=1 Tax=Pseudomonas asiatica TaxID=2219225 RepID=UPI001E4F1FD7|nr:zonular occludens toxin domain-containing protein [Pseudomonas asiatica]MCE1097549.1 hypothetical protein [Pseudomonas asiatica]MCE1102910.1 hypothetical protein [Pseudomonas asiatica]
MPIHAYVGKPGHGKSYGVVERVVIPSLKQNRHVVTNIPLNADELLADFGGFITQLPEDWHLRDNLSELIPNGCVAVLDEVWRRWPNGQRSNMANETDKSLLAEHRHRVDSSNNSMRIVLVTQDLQQIAHWARSLIETTFRVVKISKKTYRVDAYSGVVTGDAPSKTKLIRQYPGIFRADIYRYYSSATQSLTGEVGDESVADKSASIMRSWGLWIAIGSSVLLIVLGLYGVTSFFKTKPNVEPSSEKTVPARSLVTEKHKSPPIVFSQEWRLSGFVHPSRPKPGNTSTAWAVLTNKSGMSRYIPFEACTYFDGFKEAYCDIDGQRITPWTINDHSSPIPFMEAIGGSTAKHRVSSQPTDGQL